MALFSNLATERQREILNTSKETLIGELALILLRHGEDPDSFDTANPAEIVGLAASEQLRIEKICASIFIIDSKITALG